MADGSGVITPSGAVYAGAPGKLKVVGFAGGGGSSEAIKLALGCDPDLAMNHWLTAVLAHQRHFPRTEHFCADIFDVDPRAWRPEERIAFGWFSPDCTDFSKAKGKAPRSDRIRGLAWSVIPWAAFRMIDCIMLENVEEFAEWGPTYRAGPKIGEPIPERRGETFRLWRKRLAQLGYWTEWRVLNAADYGAPTTRKRLYLIARHVGVLQLQAIALGVIPSPIVWPAPTHAPRKVAAAKGLKPWRGACEIIDWSEPCPSIFLDPEEVKDLRERTGKRVQRPLVAATQKRIARGLERYVIGSAEPFIVPITQRTWGLDRAHGVRDPLKTITSAKGGEFALGDVEVATMASVAHGGEARAWPIEEPARTQTGHHDKALITGSLVGLAHGEHVDRPGSRVRDLRDAIQTVSAGGGDAALMAGSLVRTNFHSAAERNGIRDAEEPMATSTGDGGIGLMGATLVPSYSEREGQDPRALAVDEPYPTIVPGGNGGRLAAAHLVRQFGTGGPTDAEEPLHTIMPCGGEKGGGGKDQLITAYMAQGNEDRLGRPSEDPITAITGRATQQQIVAATVDSYYSSGSVGSNPAAPMRASTGKARHSLIAAWLEQANTGMVGHEATAPVSTIVAGGGPDCGWGGATQRLVEARLEQDGGLVGRRAKVLEFLWHHFGLPTQDEWDAPTDTLEARKKFGLVILRGQTWMIVDIGLRMLLPKELGAAMGLPDAFDLTVDANGRPISKTHQTQMIGNMVSPPPAAALIAANCADLIEPEQRKAA